MTKTRLTKNESKGKQQKQQQSSRPHNLAFIHRDRGYRYQDRDPMMEELCELVTQSELSTWAISEKVAHMTNGVYRVAPATIDRWLDGRTRRPTHFTMMWVSHALGYERVWRKR